MKIFDPSKYRSLADNEIIRDGDVIKDLDRGAYFLIEEGSIDVLLEGMTVAKAKECTSVDDVLRHA